MAAPFERAFDDFRQRQEEASKFTRESAPEGVTEGGDVMAIHYRDEEAIYIKASHDRVTVIFSTIFREETDRIFGKVFLQVSLLGCMRHGSAQTKDRNSLTHDEERFKTLHRSCFATSHLLSFRVCKACRMAATGRSAMSRLVSYLIAFPERDIDRRQCSFHDISRHKGGTRPSPISKHFEITFTTTSKLQRYSGYPEPPHNVR